MKKTFLRFASTFFLFSALFLYPSLSLYAAIYYVDATSGTDANDGLSQDTAWKTIAKINASRFNPGDRILFKRGEVWREQLTAPSSGSYGLPIIFGAFGIGADSLPVISGADLIIPGASWDHYTGNVWRSALAIEPKLIFFDGFVGQKQASVGALASARDWYWAGNVLYVYSTNAPDTAYVSPGIEAAQRNYGITFNSKSYITASGISVRGANIAGIYSSTGGNNIVTGCTTNYNAGIGIKISGSNDTVTGSTSQYNNVGIGVYNEPAPDVATISYNTVSNNTYPGTWNADGIRISYFTNVTVEHNAISGHTEGDSSDGISFGTSSSGIVRYNNISESKNAHITLTDNCGPVSVYYNVLKNLKQTSNASITVYNVNEKIELYNNTIYDVVDGSGSHALSISDSVVPGVVVKNNIVYVSFGAGSGVAFRKTTGATDAHLTLTNNVYYKASGNLIEWDAKEYSTSQFSSYQSYTRKDANSLMADPLFVNTGTDFHLQFASPAINAGVDVGLTQDYQGLKVPRERAPDIGAYGYQSGSSPAPPTGLKILTP